MELREVGWGGVDWIDLAQDKGQVTGACKCDIELSGVVKCEEFLE
jgi:hypothetical protein